VAGVEEVLKNLGLDLKVIKWLLEKNGKISFSYKIYELLIISLKAYSDIEFNKNYRKIENP
jgi:hypothetical protein